MMGAKEMLVEHFGTILCLLFYMDWLGCSSAVLERDKRKKMSPTATMESLSPPDNESYAMPSKRDQADAVEPEPPPSSGSTRTRTTMKKEVI